MRWLALASLLLVTGCLNPPSDGGGGDPDAAPDDAMAVSPDAAGENLLPNGDFESGLAGWDVDAAQAELFDDGPPHGGVRSASICVADVEPLPDAYSLFGTAFVPVEPGTYRFTAWTRAGDGASGQLMSGVISGTDVYVVSPPIAVADAWEQLEMELTFGAANTVTVAVRATPTDAGDCFLVDDARLVRQ